MSKTTSKIDISKYTETGFEDFSQKDLGISFLSIIQALSDQKKEHMDCYIPDAKDGDIIDSVSGQIVYSSKSNDPLLIVVCKRVHAINEWVPREKGGGLVASAPVASEQAKSILSKGTGNFDNNMEVTKDGNQLVETVYLMCKYWDVALEKWVPAVIALKISQLKKWRDIANITSRVKLNGADVPIFCQILEATTVLETKHNHSWYNWKFSFHKILESQEDADRMLEYRNEKENLMLMANNDGNSPKQIEEVAEDPFVGS